MNIADKIIRTVIAIIGETFAVITTLVKYVLAMIWITYRTMRGKNFKKMIRRANRHFVYELKLSWMVICDKESE